MEQPFPGLGHCCSGHGLCLSPWQMPAKGRESTCSPDTLLTGRAEMEHAPPAQGTRGTGGGESHLVTASRHRQMSLCHCGRAGQVLHMHPCMSQLSQRYLKAQPPHYHHLGKPCCFLALLGFLHRACSALQLSVPISMLQQHVTSR